jgi:GH15 family glucan-1,4-alpha-glucosidase
MVMVAAESREELLELHSWLVKMGPQGVIDRTTGVLAAVGRRDQHELRQPPAGGRRPVQAVAARAAHADRQRRRDHRANDSDIMQFARDTYSYMWPRDGALVANALDLAGFPTWRAGSTRSASRSSPTRATSSTSTTRTARPRARGTRGCSRAAGDADPGGRDGLVVWALWRHYYRYRDIEFIRPLWVDVVQKAADFMVRYRDPRTGLPLPSYDLWEERWGVHAFTVATVYGGLKAAHNFAVAFGDRDRAATYGRAAEEVRAGAAKYLFSERLDRFVRRLVPRDTPKPPDNATYTEPAPLLTPDAYCADVYEVDETIDASLYAIFKFHLFEADDPRVASTMKAVEQKLWVKTRVGGVARYENDYYHRVSDNIADVPGNPWFICTLWLADYYISRAKTADDLKLALPIFEWTAAHALESGVLAEQVNPYTNEPLSVSPLTWSHATVVSTAIKYLEKLEQLQPCVTCSQPVFRLRRRAGRWR